MRCAVLRDADTYLRDILNAAFGDAVQETGLCDATCVRRCMKLLNRDVRADREVAICIAPEVYVQRQRPIAITLPGA